MAVYVLNPNGSIQKAGVNDQNQPINEIIPEKEGYKVALEALGDFKSGTNYALNDHTVFEGNDNSSPLPDETVPNLNDLAITSTSGIIGQSNKLYPYAFGKNMDLTNPTTEKLAFYKPYNSFFDLDFRESGRSDNEIQASGFELFADEAELLYGIPMSYIESDKILGDLSNTFNSLLDMLLGAIIPITAISVLQGLLQVAQNGPPDPFNILGLDIKLEAGDKKGKFINYVKIDPAFNPILSSILNPIIDGLVSILKTSERLMNFPSQPASPGFIGILNDLLFNTVSFSIGYIFYLIPGFKIDMALSANSTGRVIDSLFGTIGSLISSAGKSRHNYNLLIRKIVKNNYFRRQIQFKAKQITDKNGNIIYDYTTQFWYPLSDFFHRFIGQRMAVGQKAINILKASDYNKKNNLFSVQKMNELPIIQKKDDVKSPVPVPMGSSVLGGSKNENKRDLMTSDFNKSIYSLNSLITKTSTANNYMKYHEALIKQNEAIYQNKEKRLSKEHVKELEAIINSDYMPFSIQDLRTNELFKFHAFVEGYSDSFSVGWEDGGAGFGRMDPIKIYKGTSRKISVDFWLISMSPDDFDYMWWMINRLIALIYPQWSAPKPANYENQLKAGLLKKDKTFNGIPFSQPFTQIPTGSPLVRLRLGDIFTSNYSKKSLARIFGFNLQKFNKEDITTDIATIKSKSLSNNDNNQNYNTPRLEGYDIYTKSQYKDFTTGKVFFPWDELTQQDFKKVDNTKVTIIVEKMETYLNDISKLFSKYSNFYYNDNTNIDLDDINAPGDNGEDIFAPTDLIRFFTKLVYVPIPIFEEEEEKILMLLFSINIKPNNNVIPKLKSEIPKLFIEIINKTMLEISLQNNKADANSIKNNLNLEAFMRADGQLQLNEEVNGQNNNVNIDLFENSAGVVNNPIVKSFESTMGEGLAGTIQGFTINFDQNIPWEIDEGSRAPIAVKIGLQLDVIHDILPGLDDKGIMRAPTYRVGNINNEFFGRSVYDGLPRNLGYTNEQVPPKNNTTTTTVPIPGIPDWTSPPPPPSPPSPLLPQ
jgi:hypothetical protein